MMNRDGDQETQAKSSEEAVARTMICRTVNILQNAAHQRRLGFVLYGR